ncbi:MAG: prephenate dehydrogenase/arogenate dehydrogenase family protein [Deltaproteobacteria bacterium]
MKTRPYFENVAIIGVGLIGGSLAYVLKGKGLCKNIVGIGRGIENLREAKRLRLVDEITQDIGSGVKDAGLVVVAVPVLKVAEVIKAAAPFLKKGAIVTDVGSVKQAIIDPVEINLPKGVHFVPGHPVAGTENSGAASAVHGLFKGRKCILTPTKKTNRKALSIIKKLWQEAGSEVVLMDPRTHDRVMAAVSHLPHLIAYELVNTVADAENKKGEVLQYSAGGFKDFTRIASSSPEMWADICGMNKGFIIEMIEMFKKRLNIVERLVKKGDIAALKRDFSMAKGIRDSLIDSLMKEKTVF